jgi:hypothetical protein
MGALDRSISEIAQNQFAYTPTTNALAEAIVDLGCEYPSLANWNDAKGRTQKEVVDLVEAARKKMLKGTS